MQKTDKSKLRTYGKLFYVMFCLSCFTFGGGYIIVALMKKKLVDELHWLSEEEMLDYTTVAQTAPGPVAINASILCGYRIAGGGGAAVAILGAILPPMLIVVVIASFYAAFHSNPIIRAALGGMQAGVAAILFDLTRGLCSTIFHAKHMVQILIFAGAFSAVYFFDIAILPVFAVCILIGIFTSLPKRRHKSPPPLPTQKNGDAP